MLAEDVTNPGTYTVETETFTLNNPTKTGYKFVGWATSENANTGVETVTIEKGTTGDKTFFAVWERALADLTIKITGSNTGKNYVFVVKNSTNTEVNRMVLHEGKKEITICDLPVDTYTVTPLSGWVWRQRATSDKSSVNLADGDATVTFGCSFIGGLKYWLNGYSYGKKGG